MRPPPLSLKEAGACALLATQKKMLVGLAFSEDDDEEAGAMVRLPVPAVPNLQELAEQLLLDRSSRIVAVLASSGKRKGEDDEDEDEGWEVEAAQGIRAAFAPRVQRLAAYLRCVAEELELTQTAMVEAAGRLISTPDGRQRKRLRPFGHYDCGHGAADLDDVVALAERAEEEAAAVLMLRNGSAPPTEEEERWGDGLCLEKEEEA